MKKILKTIASLLAVTAMMGAMTVMPATAEVSTTNLFSSATLRKADYRGTDTTATFAELTDGTYTDSHTINRNGGNNTYYAVYEVNSAIRTFSAYYTDSAGSANGGKVIFFGSNDENLALLTAAPESDLGWKGDGTDKSDTDFKNTYNLTFLGNTENGTQETLTQNETTYYKKSIATEDETVYKYIVVLVNGWSATNLSEIEAVAKDTGALSLGEVFAFTGASAPDVAIKLYYAKSKVTHNVVYSDKGVTVVAGNNAASASVYWGNRESVGTVTGTVFESLGNNSTVWRITNTDNVSDAKYRGYMTVRAAITEAGRYRISFLGNATNRGFSISWGDSKNATTQNIASGTAIVSADVDITDEDISGGVVTFKITGNTNCPNIYAFQIASLTSAAATATITDRSSGSETSSSFGISVTTGAAVSESITIKIDGKTIMNYPADNTGIEAGKTINFGVLVRRRVTADNITVEVDGTPVTKTVN